MKTKEVLVYKGLVSSQKDSGRSWSEFESSRGERLFTKLIPYDPKKHSERSCYFLRPECASNGFQKNQKTKKWIEDHLGTDTWKRTYEDYMLGDSPDRHEEKCSNAASCPPSGHPSGSSRNATRDTAMDTGIGHHGFGENPQNNINPSSSNEIDETSKNTQIKQEKRKLKSNYSKYLEKIHNPCRHRFKLKNKTTLKFSMSHYKLAIEKMHKMMKEGKSASETSEKTGLLRNSIYNHYYKYH